ncbi:MAG: YciI family protein [Planctomycetaceae bacterium]
MKYMLLVYSPENAWSPEEWIKCVETSMGICQEMAAKGQLLSAAPLLPVATGSTVRVRDGQRLITTGPFAETTEQLGGYYIIDVENLDEAIAVAGRLPPAAKGTVEIRPLFRLEGLPVEKLSPEFTASDTSLSQFMFLCYDDEEAWRKAGQEAHHAAMLEAVELTHWLDQRGQYLNASPLHPVATATSVRVRNGHRTVTDGPFAETREVLGGYYIILAKDQSEALEIAARHSGARVGAVEVRQVFDLAKMSPAPANS